MIRTTLALAVTALAGHGAAQIAPPAAPLDLRQAPLELPDLPPVRTDSPRDSLLYADRFEVRPTAEAASTGGLLVDHVIPAAVTGTGKNEILQYQLPANYDPTGPAHPLLIAYHGFGSSAGSVAVQSLLDEECFARGWIYLAPTGIDDKLFGAPIVQQNLEAALSWAFEDLHVDEDRVYAVGFSMGAGVVTNFAARHRDPDGIMIAGLGTVSGSFDWTQSYNLDPALEPWLENPFNFGGSPDEEPFRYRQASTLHFGETSYPPLPGALLADESMGTNLAGLPVYVSWDVDDSIPELPPQSEAFVDLLTTLGADVVSRPVSGTIDPDTGAPATHSWAVLDTTELCDRLETAVADRTPTTFSAQLDRATSVSFVAAEPRAPETFGYVSASVDAGAGTVTISEARDLSRALVTRSHAGLPPTAPLALDASNADADGLRVGVADPASPPSWATSASGGAPLPALEWDPAAGALTLPVPGSSAVSVRVLTEPWEAALTVAPDPASPGDALTITLDAARGPTTAWLLVGLGTAVLPLASGQTLLVPPVILVPVPLDGAGAALLGATLSADPGISGARVLLQFVTLDAATGAIAEISNPFAFDVL